MWRVLAQALTTSEPACLLLPKEETPAAALLGQARLGACGALTATSKSWSTSQGLSVTWKGLQEPCTFPEQELASKDGD